MNENFLHNFDDNKNIYKITSFSEKMKEPSNSICDDKRFFYKFKNVYDSLSDDDIEDAIKTTNEYSISINGQFKYILNLINLIFVIYSVTIIPYLLAFDLEKLSVVKGIQILIDIFFILNIFFKFVSEYLDEKENIISGFEKIFYNYLYNSFIFDFITAIPFTAIRYLCYGWTNLFLNFSNYSIEAMFKWLKILRIIELINSKEFIELKFTDDSKINRVLKSAIVFICFTHISSCVWIYIGRYDININNWIINISLQDSNFSDIYLASFYFNLVTIYTIGYGDILASNLMEYIYLVFLLIFGVMLFSFGISSLSSIFGSYDTRNTIFNAKCFILDIIDEEYFLEEDVYCNIKTYLKYELKKNKNDIFELLESLPIHVKNELTIYMYRILIKDLKFFKDQSLDFILFVLPLIKSQKVIRGNIMLSIGELMEEMYLVVNGCLGIYLGLSFDNLEIGIVKQNCHFGELLMQINQKSPYQIKCKSSVAEILVLKREDFIKIKNNFKSNIINILKESYSDLETLNMRTQQFLQLYKYENSVFGVKTIIKDLNMYLLERDFDEYYYNKKELEDANDFILKHNFEEISKVLIEYKKTNKNSKIRFENNLKSKVKNNLSKKVSKTKDHDEKIVIDTNKIPDNFNSFKLNPNNSIKNNEEDSIICNSLGNIQSKENKIDQKEYLGNIIDSEFNTLKDNYLKLKLEAIDNVKSEKDILAKNVNKTQYFKNISKQDLRSIPSDSELNELKEKTLILLNSKNNLTKAKSLKYEENPLEQKNKIFDKTTKKFRNSDCKNLSEFQNNLIVNDSNSRRHKIPTILNTNKLKDSNIIYYDKKPDLEVSSSVKLEIIQSHTNHSVDLYKLKNVNKFDGLTIENNDKMKFTIIKNNGIECDRISENKENIHPPSKNCSKQEKQSIIMNFDDSINGNYGSIKFNNLNKKKDPQSNRLNKIDFTSQNFIEVNNYNFANNINIDKNNIKSSFEKIDCNSLIHNQYLGDITKLLKFNDKLKNILILLQNNMFNNDSCLSSSN